MSVASSNSKVRVQNGIRSFPNLSDEIPYIIPRRMPVDSGKAGPAECEAQIIEERQPVSLAGEQRVGTEIWHQDPIWGSSAVTEFPTRLDCKRAGDFDGFTPQQHLASYRRYYGLAS
ncbi:hypothetical protein [Bradyrhizobium sp. ORS 285]|uniref:hypothetical protein n=1 Tax=Bradyrhizobium sp. ORS 285 TaxID=115808 RepID=UPI001FCB3E6D|nr:hypothetical protein [Bradyrhizobium sp. ORS 285]